MPRIFKSWKGSSKSDWGTNLDPEVDSLSTDQVKTGALLRIADAVELVAKDRVKMEKDLELYRTAYQKSQAEIANLNHKISGYKSHITRLKNKLNS